MLKLIPMPKKLVFGDGTLSAAAIFFDRTSYSERLIKALDKLPFSLQGAPLHMTVGAGKGEGYSLCITPDAIRIEAESEAGAFYAIQTLRQIFFQGAAPCLEIEDRPDFAYRGFYHDVTRGKVPTLATLKGLIDTLAYYKMNALQLYVEHTFDFEETRELVKTTSCLTGEELRELDAYCRENFIDFQPSLSTFGHMFELLELPEHHHLRVLKDFEPSPCRWHDRMKHHTVDPSQEQSFSLVKSLIDQYAPHFTSSYFNICCDETFDLIATLPKETEGKLYIDFVKKIVDHVTKKGKTVMMWADILLKHPEYISEPPEDVYFLNWNYDFAPSEKNIEIFAKLGRKQIVCPGTTTWNRFAEHVKCEEANITLMAEYGHKHGALGLLNTNWGDYGNIASLDTSMYGLVLGAAKSWSVATELDRAWESSVNTLLYQNENGLAHLRAVSDLISLVKWPRIARAGCDRRAGLAADAPITEQEVLDVQQGYSNITAELLEECWSTGDFKDELLLATQGTCLLAELAAGVADLSIERVTDTEDFLCRYREKWLSKNKPSELWHLEEFLRYCDTLCR